MGVRGMNDEKATFKLSSKDVYELVCPKGRKDFVAEKLTPSRKEHGVSK